LFPFGVEEENKENGDLAPDAEIVLLGLTRTNKERGDLCWPSDAEGEGIFGTGEVAVPAEESPAGGGYWIEANNGVAGVLMEDGFGTNGAVRRTFHGSAAEGGDPKKGFICARKGFGKGIEEQWASSEASQEYRGKNSKVDSPGKAHNSGHSPSPFMKDGLTLSIHHVQT